MNYASILRSESLHLAELSDLRVFAINRPGDIDKMPIVLMECQTGKRNIVDDFDRNVDRNVAS